MNKTYEIFQEIANQTIENLETLEDNMTQDKQYILDCIGKEEMYTLYSDGGWKYITGFMSHLHLLDKSIVDERLRKIRELVDERIDNVRSWNQLINNDTYNHEETNRLLETLTTYLFDSELMTKYLLPNILVPLIEKFGKTHPQQIVSLVVSKWSLMDRLHHISDVLDNLFRDVDHSSLDLFNGLDKDDIELYDSLPDKGKFRVYRGCFFKNRMGYSWSLSEDTAIRFPFLVGNDTDHTPILLSGLVSKKDVLFCVGSRGEEEIVIDPRKVSRSSIRSIITTIHPQFI